MENAPERCAPGAIYLAPSAGAPGAIYLAPALRAGRDCAAYFAAGLGSLRAMSHCTCTSFWMGLSFES